MTAHVAGPHLHVANAGDCGAVLGTQNEDGSWEAKPLSVAHHTENKSEQVSAVFSFIIETSQEFVW